MASIGSLEGIRLARRTRRVEEALKLMAEAIKSKLAEMEPSSGVASASAPAEQTDAPGEVSVDEVETAPVAVLTEMPLLEKFVKNLYPRWSIDMGFRERKSIYFSTGYFRNHTYLTDDILTYMQGDYTVEFFALGGGTALHWAVRMEDLESVTGILEACQVDVNAKDEVWKATALHWAVRIGNLDIVKAMYTHHLALGANHSALWKFDLEVRDRWGFTALECALLKSHVPMVKALFQFEHKGVVKEINDELRKCGSTEVLLHYFEQQGFKYWFDVVGASFHWVVRMGDSTLASQILTEGKLDVNGKDSYSHTWGTPLHFAILSKNLDIVKILVACDRVDVNAKYNHEYTSLHLAILSRNVNMVKVMVEKHLKRRNYDVNFVETETGYTALHCAILNGKEENIYMVRELLKCKETMRLTEECHNGKTPLQIAHERGFKDIQKSLMECEGVQRFVDELYRDRQVYVDAANAILVGAALIASVTFASWLQPPLGYGTLGYVDVQHNQGLRAFWIFNCLSFYFAIGTVVFGARSVLPRSPYFIKVTVEKLRTNLLYTASLLACSVFFVIIAFGIAGCLVLSPIFEFQLYMIVPTIIGGLVCVVSLVLLSKSMWQDSSLGKSSALVKMEEWKRTTEEREQDFQAVHGQMNNL